MQPAQLELERQSGANGGSLVTHLRGKLSLETVHKFIETMRAEPAPHLILDLSGVTFLDSAGVGGLVSLFVTRRNGQKSLGLASLTQQGTAVMQVAGLMSVLPIFPTVDAAIAAHK